MKWEWVSMKDGPPKKEGWYHVVMLDKKTGYRRVEQDLYAIELAEMHGKEPGFCKDGRWEGREIVTNWHPFPELPEYD